MTREMIRDFAGRTALVTGGGSGIGRALVLALVRENVRVVIADILFANAQAVAAEVECAGGQALAVQCDVCDAAAIARMRAQARAFGPVTLLFANAGATSFERLSEMPAKDIDWILQVNLVGVVQSITAFLPEMIAAGEGHIVATASAAGLLPAWVPYHAPYSAAKAGIIGLMLNLRHELGEAGIGATVLCPFGVATNMQRDNQRYRPEKFGGPGSEPVKLPGRFFDEAALAFRTPEEVAEMVLRAVRQNLPMVVTDPSQRDAFQRGYADLVLRAFDEAAAFDREHGR
jgi:NAD(P)-dependent dehydrogenase (short-subunit alcohol dehydrogenase family)